MLNVKAGYEETALLHVAIADTTRPSYSEICIPFPILHAVKSNCRMAHTSNYTSLYDMSEGNVNKKRIT